VTPVSAPALPEARYAACIFFIFLVPFAGAGLALINAGLGRSRSAAHLMLASICVIAIAAISYFTCGFAWQGFPGQPEHSLNIAGKNWSWIAAGPFFLRGLQFDGSPAALAAWFGMLSAGLAGMIPLGAGADRWRLGATCASTALLAAVTFPLYAHWIWGGGWLAALGANYGLGHGFIDAGGSSAIQAVGGLTALAVTWILGPRRGKYLPDGTPTAIPGHNTVVVTFGCFMALIGWLGLNSAGAILFTGAALPRVVLVAINTTLAAASASLAAAAITRIRFTRPDASLCANGWVAGLASSSAACALMPPAAAVMTGLVAGALAVFMIEWLEVHLSIDDPGGAVSVHAVGGLWGILALGLFARFPDGAGGQWLAQLVGVATLLGFVFPLTYWVNWMLNRLYAQRVALEGERQGMDLYELGAGAYPEFMIHNEEFPR
jgi:Amt family ammonium transporter